MSPAVREVPAPGQGASLLHNMSAPPRSIVVVNPLRPAAPRRRKGEPPLAGPAPRATPTARHFARVCLVSVLGGGEVHEPMGRDIARYVVRGEPRPHGGALDLVDAVALLRAGEPTGPANAAQREACEDLPLHALHDEFLERVAALGDMGLPPLLLARPADFRLPAPATSSLPSQSSPPSPSPRSLPSHPAPLTPLAALRLLAGTAGGLFLRGRTPGASMFLTGLPGGEPDCTTFDYYQPAAPGAGAPR